MLIPKKLAKGGAHLIIGVAIRVNIYMVELAVKNARIFRMTVCIPSHSQGYIIFIYDYSIVLNLI